MVTEDVVFDKDGRIERLPWLKKFYLSAAIILTAGISFGLGRLSVMGERGEIRVEFDPALTSLTSQTASVVKSLPTTPTSHSETVFASKNGKKYYYAHCAGVKRIKDENKITFASRETAEASGYTQASGCAPR